MKREKSLIYIAIIIVVISLLVIVLTLAILVYQKELWLGYDVDYNKLRSIGTFFGGVLAPLLTMATVLVLAANYIHSYKVKKLDNIKYKNDKRLERKKNQLELNELKMKEWVDSFYKLVDKIKELNDKESIKVFEPVKNRFDYGEDENKIFTFFIDYIYILKKLESFDGFPYVDNYISTFVGRYEGIVFVLNQCPKKNDKKLFYTYVNHLSVTLGSEASGFIMQILKVKEFADKHEVLKEYFDEHFPCSEEFEKARIEFLKNRKKYFDAINIELAIKVSEKEKV